MFSCSLRTFADLLPQIGITLFSSKLNVLFVQVSENEKDVEDPAGGAAKSKNRRKKKKKTSDVEDPSDIQASWQTIWHKMFKPSLCVQIFPLLMF